MNERGITVGSLLRWTLIRPDRCDIHCYLGRLDKDEMGLGKGYVGKDVVVSVENGVVHGVDVDEQYGDGPYIWQLLWLAPDDVASSASSDDDRP